MRISRIHLDSQLGAGANLTLDADISHYLATVLRLRADASLLVFNASDGEYAARITSVEKHVVKIELGALQRTPPESGLVIRLGLGISRGDRMDFAIQKSTELGVTAITPLYSQYGEVKLKNDRVNNKLRHWNKIATGAAEQCGRLDVPTINPPQAIADWTATRNEQLRLLLDPTGHKRISALDTPTIQDIALLVGPEGGFSEQELAQGQKQGFEIVTLGDRILRTETAPIAALAILQTRFGDM